MILPDDIFLYAHETPELYNWHSIGDVILKKNREKKHLINSFGPAY